MSCGTHEDEGEMRGQVLWSSKNKPDECIAVPLSEEDFKKSSEAPQQLRGMFNQAGDGKQKNLCLV